METMKKICGKLIFGVVLCLTLSVGFVSMQAQAAPKLNKKTATITVGKTLKLKVKGTKKKVKWSSSKKSVCTVNQSGKVTAKKAGKAVIKAKVAKKTLKCNVTVKAKKTPKPTPVTPTGLSVTGPLTKIAPGGTMQLQLGYAPANAEHAAVKWSTSNSRRATVTSTGLVTAVSTGEVTITAELQSNWRVNGKFTFTVEDLKVEGTVSTADGGDLLLSEASSQAVYDYTVSYTVAGVQTQVVDGVGNVIRTYPAGKIGPATPVHVVWDLKDSAGNQVAPGIYCFQVVVAGTKIPSEYFEIYTKSEFDAGNGSPAAPYEISTLEQLKLVWKHNNVCFKQTADIDANYTAITPIFSTDKPFQGTYDGGNYTISNISNTMTDISNVGLFCAIGSKGVVKNLKITDSSIIGKSAVGAIAGVNQQGGQIINCTVKKCSLRGTNGNAGAIVGNNYGTIRDCLTEENSTSADNGHAGGVCAYNQATIVDCKSGESVTEEVSVKGHYVYAGGIVGYNDGNVLRCTIYSANLTVDQDWGTRAGGIVGYNKGSVSNNTVEECTWECKWTSKGGIIGYNDGGTHSSNNWQGSEKQVGNGN